MASDANTSHDHPRRSSNSDNIASNTDNSRKEIEQAISHIKNEIRQINEGFLDEQLLSLCQHPLPSGRFRSIQKYCQFPAPPKIDEQVLKKALLLSSSNKSKIRAVEIKGREAPIKVENNIPTDKKDIEEGETPKKDIVNASPPANQDMVDVMDVIIEHAVELSTNTHKYARVNLETSVKGLHGLKKKLTSREISSWRAFATEMTAVCEQVITKIQSKDEAVLVKEILQFGQERISSASTASTNPNEVIKPPRSDMNGESPTQGTTRQSTRARNKKRGLNDVGDAEADRCETFVELDSRSRKDEASSLTDERTADGDLPKKNSRVKRSSSRIDSGKGDSATREVRTRSGRDGQNEKQNTVSTRRSALKRRTEADDTRDSGRRTSKRTRTKPQ